jgi:hypothetical protein
MDDKEARASRVGSEKKQPAPARTETVEMAECVSPVLVWSCKLRGKRTVRRECPQYAYGRLHQIRS